MNNEPAHSPRAPKEEDLEPFQIYIESNRRTFVSQPFDPPHDRVFEGAIKPACKSENVACLRANQIYTSASITNDIITCIKLANAVIVDISGSNPNVLFELGLCFLNKKNFLIKTDKDEVTSNLRGLRYIPYSNTRKGLKTLKKELRKFLITAVGKT